MTVAKLAVGDKNIFEVKREMSKFYKYVFAKLPLNLKVDEKVFHVKKFPKMILIFKKVKEDKKPKEDKVKETKVVEVDPNKEYKYILSQRKAYVDFINKDFYDKLMLDVDNDMYKNYQKFVKGYLSLETPFRGLLVYHGLGTGKTATSVITVEGDSSDKYPLTNN
jgi:hypothetical protein